jgi:very-short-patch-repair endonuclease
LSIVNDFNARAWPDAVIGHLAGRQATMIAHRQLIAAGVHPDTITAAVRRGRLYRVHHGVFSLVPEAARPLWAPEWAGLLAVPGAVLSHHTAARLHDLGVHWFGAVELTLVDGDRGRGRAGLLVHRTALLPRGELVRVGGMGVTSVARTVLDLSPALGTRALERLVDAALRRTSRAKLLSVIEGHPRARGCRRMLAALDPARPTEDAWSRAEARLLRLIRGAGLPAPDTTNVWLGSYKPDMLWREQRVIVEYDSYEFHSGPGSFRADRARNNDLTAAGYQVLQVTYDVLAGHPERVLVWIATALARAER